MNKKIGILILITFVFSFIILQLFNSAEVFAATELTNASFTVGNDVPVIIHVTVTTNATRVTAGGTGILGANSKPTNVTQHVNFTLKYIDANKDSVTILVCKTNAASASGCTNPGYLINQTAFSTANRSALNRTTLKLASFLPYYNNTNTTIAYLFVSDGRGVSASRNVSFSVNHAPTMTSPSVTGSGGVINYTNETYTAGLRNLYDVDNANTTIKFGSYRVSYRWFRSATGSSAWSDTGVTTQTFDCVAQTCNKLDVLRLEVRARDNLGYSNSSSLKNSTNMTIANSPPLPPSSFQVRDGTGSLDTTDSFDTHAKNGTGPEIKWTDGTDPDSDTMFTYVCARTSPVRNLTTTRVACHADLSVAQNKQSLINVTRVSAGTLYKTIGSLRFHATANANVTYVELITTDGTTNSTIYNVTLYLNNSKPVVSSSGVNATRIHDQSPVLKWNVTDYDNGRVNGWPRDGLTHHIRIGSAASGSQYNTSKNANNNSYSVFPNIPWNTTVLALTSARYWSNRTTYVDLWTTDNTSTVYGNATKVADTFVLFDYLSRVVYINMSNHQAASSYLSCASNAATLCQLTPIEHSNTTVAIKMAVEDRDGDCSATNHDAWVSLCKNQTTNAVCAESTTGTYRFNLSRVHSTNASRCLFQRTANSSTKNSPEFFINATAWKLYGNISNNQSVKMLNDAGRNGSWSFTELSAINYTGAVSLGNDSVKLGHWSFGKNRYVLKNWGNVNLTLKWNMSNPRRSGGSEYWPLNGTDATIDDDNNITSDNEGALRRTNLTRGAVHFTFDPPGWGLVQCLYYNCSINTWNETLNTHYHIWAPSNLTAGTYAATVWVVTGT